MKLIKKIAAIMFAFMMVFSLSTNAKAEGTTGAITITNAIDGQDYSIYKIMTLESYNPKEQLYSYKPASSQWEKFFRTDPVAKKYITLNDDNGITWTTQKGATEAEDDYRTKLEQEAAELAKAALSYAKNPDNNIKATETQTKDVNNTISFTKLDLGYYLVDSNVGALCGLTTTANEATIFEKNEKPTLKKYVNTYNSGYPNYADSDSLKKNTTNEIGDTVHFTAEIDNFKGAENLLFTDTMDSGLTLMRISSTQVYIQVNLVKRNVTKNVEHSDVVDLNTPADYTVSDGNEDGKDKFTLTFTPEGYKKLEQYYKDYVLRISYAAIVNKNAKVDNVNTANLNYGNSPNAITSTAHVGVLSIRVLKTKTDNTPLKDAEFSLYTSKDDAVKGENPIEFKKDDNSKEIYRKATADETNAENKTTTNKIITNSDGEFTFYGLKARPYYLKEIKAPEGYNKLNEPIEVTVKKVEDETNVITGYLLDYKYGNTSKVGAEKVQVINKTGSILPSTGGMGTTLIYLVYQVVH